AAAGDSPYQFEAVIVGNHGVLSWEGDESRLWTVSPAQRSFAVTPDMAPYFKLLSAALNAAPRAESKGLRPAAIKSSPRPVKPPYGVLLVAGDYTHQPNYASALAADPRCKLIALCDGPNIDE